jgi:hypothetical protein
LKSQLKVFENQICKLAEPAAQPAFWRLKKSRLSGSQENQSLLSRLNMKRPHEGTTTNDWSHNPESYVYSQKATGSDRGNKDRILKSVEVE